MNIEQFKKASKRLSLDAAIPLNQAREKMASYFGYPNFDAAQKLLRSSSQEPPSTLSKAHFWADASKDEFLLLVHLLKARHLAATSDKWVEQGLRVLDIAILTAVAQEGKSLTVKDLRKQTQLPQILAERARIQADFGHVHSDDWPRAPRKVKDYLEWLPGIPLSPKGTTGGAEFWEALKYQVDAHDPKISNLRDQHNYRKMFANRVLDTLEFIAEAGGTRAVEVPCSERDGRLVQTSSAQSLHRLLEEFARHKRAPSKSDEAIFTSCFEQENAFEVYGAFASLGE